MSQAEDAKDLSDYLYKVLIDLAQHPYPHVPNPESCQKRASVALVLRIRPNYKDWPSTSDSVSLDTNQPVADQLTAFFAQGWVHSGDPEVVFIKRAARAGDRWTSHVALPGGRRDPEDANDKAAAVRETSEEIGLDISSSDALYIGNLPERVVTTSFGRVPYALLMTRGPNKANRSRIMVLCPFIFLYTKPDIPPLKLQPTEVASTHWVPLRALLSTSVRTYEYVDTTERFARQGGVILRYLIHFVLGKMRFSAVRLTPSESVYCTSTEEFFPIEDVDKTAKLSWIRSLYKWSLGGRLRPPHTKPLLLWGLTLGILADFLDQLPPHNAVQLWSYPTFTTWDAQLIISILTAGLKKRNQSRLLAGNRTAVDNQTEAVQSDDNARFVSIASDGMKSNHTSRSYAVGIMLDGYYEKLRTAAQITVATRMVASLTLLLYIFRRYKR
jgi:8-oxo-dGTP pyrophosphatase MutT (NUDIX family)